MKKFKRCLALFLCVVTIISCIGITASAVTGDLGGGWVEVRCFKTDDCPSSFVWDEDGIKIVLKKNINPSVKSYLVNVNEVSIDDLLKIGEAEQDPADWTTYLASYKFDNEFLYNKEDNCYYAQYSVCSPDVDGAMEDCGVFGGLNVLIFGEISMFLKFINARFHPEFFQSYNLFS